MGQYQSPRAKANKELEVLVIPQLAPIPDATTAKEVGKGNLCRIKGTAGGFISFGDDEAVLNAGDINVSRKETMETEARFFIVAATGKFIRTSAAMRIEVTKD